MRLFQRYLGWQSIWRASSRPQSPRSRLFQGFKHCPNLRLNHVYGKPESIPQKIGERVLVYHAGVFLTTFVGVCKVASILWFVFHYVRVVYWWTKRYTYEFNRLYQPLSIRKVLVNLALGTAPMILILWRMKPFVASATLKTVPIGARRSLDHLYRWAEKLPYDAEIEFKMFHDYGLFRRVSVPIGELRTKKPGWVSVENLVRLRRPRFGIWKFLVIGERKANLRTRLWGKILPQLGSVETMKTEARRKR